MYKLAISIISVFGFTMACTLVFTSFSNSKNTENKEVTSIHPEAKNNLPQIIRPIPEITNPTFAGEAMPINMDTRERLDRELTVNAYWQSSTLLNIKSANKYFPIIEPILAENGIPEDFKYLAVAESNLRNVQSSASAKGFWQFMKPAAQELGLEVNDEVDERYHIEKSTRAACGYLRKQYERFGSWANAAAAYNVGPGSFSKSLGDQGESSFYDLNLNDETGRYVFRLIAIKEIMNNPEKYGFHVEPQDLYDPIDRVYYIEVDKSISDWAAFAEHHGVSYRTLKYYNPWLRSSKLTVLKNKYLIKLPRD